MPVHVSDEGRRQESAADSAAPLFMPEAHMRQEYPTCRPVLSSLMYYVKLINARHLFTAAIASFFSNLASPGALYFAFIIIFPIESTNVTSR